MLVRQVVACWHYLTGEADMLQAYLNMIRALNMNRSRMRRMLCKSVHEWENIQFEVCVKELHLLEVLAK